MFNLKVSLVPDRLAHYRVPVFDNISKNCNVNRLVVYADLCSDPSGIKKPAPNELLLFGFTTMPSRDYRLGKMLLLSTGSFKAAFDKSAVFVLWGDAFSPGNWIAVLLAKLKRKKIVFWTHGLYGSESFLKKFIRMRFYKLSDALLLYGRNSRDLLICEGFSENSLHVINNALDFSKQDAFFRKYSFLKSNDPNCLKLIFVGRLTKVKKLNYVLHALVKLREHFNVEVNFVGDGDQLNILQGLAVELCVDESVKFHGAIYDEEVLSKLILQSDIMVSPGNVGLTAMHSLIYGTPVVSHSNSKTQMPEYESIVVGRSGELFEEDDVESLVSAILNCKADITSGVISVDSCRNVIDEFYSLEYQRKVFDECILGLVGK